MRVFFIKSELKVGSIHDDMTHMQLFYVVTNDY
jgi:hypothetical protein